MKRKNEYSHHQNEESYFQKPVKSRNMSTSHLLSESSNQWNTIWESEGEYKDYSNNYSQNNIKYQMELKKIFKESIDKNTNNANLINNILKNNINFMKKEHAKDL